MDKICTVFERDADVEVLFEFLGERKNPVEEGYRPAHMIRNGYLTTGIHHYYDVDRLPPAGTAKGTITFLTPEVYPNCLWIGKKIGIQEGGTRRRICHDTKDIQPCPMCKGKHIDIDVPSVSVLYC